MEQVNVLPRLPKKVTLLALKKRGERQRFGVEEGASIVRKLKRRDSWMCRKISNWPPSARGWRGRESGKKDEEGKKHYLRLHPWPLDAPHQSWGITQLITALNNRLNSCRLLDMKRYRNVFVVRRKVPQTLVDLCQGYRGVASL